MRIVLIPLSLLLSVILSVSVLPVFAHNEIERGDIKVVGGWGFEPPLVGQVNTIVLEVTRISDGSPVANAVAQLETMIQKGGQTEPLEFTPEEEPGHFAAEILPTQTGQYAIVFQGTIAGQTFEGQIEIEDVEDTRLLEFPPTSGGSGNPIPQEILGQLQNIIASLGQQVEDATTKAAGAVEASQEAVQASEELKVSADRAYIFGMVGVGLGVAGVAIGVIALSKKTQI